jgi:hypothetical protein
VSSSFTGLPLLDKQVVADAGDAFQGWTQWTYWRGVDTQEHVSIGIYDQHVNHFRIFVQSTRIDF